MTLQLPDVRGATIVFDLDGTLVDTAPDLIRTANHILVSAGVEAVPDAILHPIISYGSRAMIETGLAHRGRHLASSDIDGLHAAFLVHYAETIADLSRPFPHVRELLVALRSAGARLAVCTNKPAALTQRLLDLLDMSALFDGTAGRDTFPHHKPDARHLLGAIDLAGGSSARAVMVGDSEIDVATARAASLPVIGVTFGYTPEPVATFGPDAVIEGYGEFPQALAGVLKA